MTSQDSAKRRYRTPLPFAAAQQKQQAVSKQTNHDRNDNISQNMASVQQPPTAPRTLMSSRSLERNYNDQKLDDDLTLLKDDLPIPPPLFTRASHDTTRSLESIHSREAVIENDSWLPYKRPERADLQKLVAELDMLETSSSSSSTDRSDASRSTVTPITEYNSRPSPSRSGTIKPAHQRINSRSGSFSKPATHRRDSVHDAHDYGFSHTRTRSIPSPKPPLPAYIDRRQKDTQSPSPEELNGRTAAQYREPAHSSPTRQNGLMQNRVRSTSSPKWNNRIYIDSSEDLRMPYKSGQSVATQDAKQHDRSASSLKDRTQAYTNGVQYDAEAPPVPYRSTSRPPMHSRQKLSFEGPLSPISIEPQNQAGIHHASREAPKPIPQAPSPSVQLQAAFEPVNHDRPVTQPITYSQRFPELHGRHERDRSQGAPEPRHATTSLNIAATGREPPVEEDKHRLEQPLAPAPLKRYPKPPSRTELEKSAPEDDLPRPRAPSLPGQRQPTKKNEYKIPKRRAASAWRPPSVWYENVEGVTLSTRPRSSKESRTGLSIPEIEARDIQDIQDIPRGRSHPNDQDCEFAENGHHFARSPPPIGARNSYIRDISPKPVANGQDHTFLDNYSRAADDEMANQRCEPPRVKRPAAEHSGAQAIDAPEPIEEQPHQEHEEDFSDHGGAEPPDIARSRALEEQDAQMKSKTEQIKSLLGGMLKTFNAKNTLKKTNSPPDSGRGSGSERERELHMEALNPQATEEADRPSRPSSVHRMAAHDDATAFLWDDSDDHDEERPRTRDTMIWSPPRATRRNSDDIYRAKRVSFYGDDDENAAPKYTSTFASLGGPR